MNILLTIIFFLALSSSVYFLGKLLTWVAWKINPNNFEKEKFTNRNISNYNITMTISILLWTLLFYLTNF